MEKLLSLLSLSSASISTVSFNVNHSINKNVLDIESGIGLTVYVDVDGTLLDNSLDNTFISTMKECPVKGLAWYNTCEVDDLAINMELVQFLIALKEKGYTLVLWTNRGIANIPMTKRNLGSFIWNMFDSHEFHSGKKINASMLEGIVIDNEEKYLTKGTLGHVHITTTLTTKQLNKGATMNSTTITTTTTTNTTNTGDNMTTTTTTTTNKGDTMNSALKTPQQQGDFMKTASKKLKYFSYALSPDGFDEFDDIDPIAAESIDSDYWCYYGSSGLTYSGHYKMPTGETYQQSQFELDTAEARAEHKELRRKSFLEKEIQEKDPARRQERYKARRKAKSKIYAANRKAKKQTLDLHKIIFD